MSNTRLTDSVTTTLMLGIYSYNYTAATHHYCNIGLNSGPDIPTDTTKLQEISNNTVTCGWPDTSTVGMSTTSNHRSVFITCSYLSRFAILQRDSFLVIAMELYFYYCRALSSCFCMETISPSMAQSFIFLS